MILIQFETKETMIKYKDLAQVSV